MSTFLTKITLSASLCFCLFGCNEDDKKKKGGSSDTVSIDSSIIKRWKKSTTTQNGQLAGTTTRTINDAGLVTQSEDVSSADVKIRTVTYEYNGDNALTKETEVTESGPITAIIEYTYDDQKRLSSIRRTANDKLIETRSYNYDNKTIDVTTYNAAAEGEEIFATINEEYYFAGTSFEGRDNFLVLKSSTTKNKDGQETGKIESSCNSETAPTECTLTSTNVLTGKKVSEITTTHSVKTIVISGVSVLTDAATKALGKQFDQDEKEVTSYEIETTYNTFFSKTGSILKNDNLVEDAQDYTNTTILTYDETGINITKSESTSVSASSTDVQVLEFEY